MNVGRKAVAAAATPETLVAASTPVGQGVMIKALPGNTDVIDVQDASGDANGYPLAAGEEVFVSIDDLFKVWLRAAVNGEGVAYSAL